MEGLVPEEERTPLTDEVIHNMRIAVRKRVYQVGGTEYMTFRAYKTRNPHVWWYDHQAWEISLFCRHNDHGEYYLELSPVSHANPKPTEWFCFLKNEQLGKTFLHLRHIKYFEELQAIVNVLTDMALCRTEHEAREWMDAMETKGGCQCEG